MYMQNVSKRYKIICSLVAGYNKYIVEVARENG